MDDLKADLVTTNGLVVRRGRFELRVPEWSVVPGKVVGIVGLNGAGKTTLLESIAGLRPVTAGSVRVFGLDPWERPEQVRSALGFMSDDMPVFPMRIDRVLRFISGYYATWDAELVGKLLDRFKLDALRKTHQLSRGEGTRLRLILAMAFRPRVLVLDEPAAALDPLARHTLLEEILGVVHDPERSVIVSSHNLHDLARVTDDLLVLRQGTVAQLGPTDELVGENQTLEEKVLEWEAV